MKKEQNTGIPLTKVERQIKNMREEVTETLRKIRILEALVLVLPPNLAYPYISSYSGLNYSGLTTESRIEVMQALGCKTPWQKSVNDYDPTKIDYKNTITVLGEELEVNLDMTDAPPSCQIIEEEVSVPETLVAAHTKIVKRLRCTADKE